MTAVAKKVVVRTIWESTCPNCGDVSIRENSAPRSRQCKCGTWVAFEEKSVEGPAVQGTYQDTPEDTPESAVPVQPAKSYMLTDIAEILLQRGWSRSKVIGLLEIVRAEEARSGLPL